MLNSKHKDGGSKASFFKKFGFSPKHIEVFVSSLLPHAATREVAEKKGLQDQKYVLTCEIKTPDNCNPCLTTIWIINKGEQCPGQVTTFPFSV